MRVGCWELFVRTARAKERESELSPQCFLLFLAWNGTFFPAHTEQANTGSHNALLTQRSIHSLTSLQASLHFRSVGKYQQNGSPDFEWIDEQQCEECVR